VRRVLRGLATVVLLAFIGLWGWSAISHAVPAARDLYRGKAEAERAKGDTAASSVESGSLLAHLNRAKQDFAHAHADLGVLSVRSLDWVPVLGRQIRSARALAGAGASVSDAAALAVTQLRGDLRAVPGNGPTRLARMRDFLAAGRRAQASLDRVSLGPRVGLLRPLATAHNQLLAELVKARTGLTRGVAASQALVDLLQGQHRVLVLITNNAEMRAGSGMILQIGTLDLNDGQAHFTDRGSSGLFPLRPGVVPISGDFASQWGWVRPTETFDELLATPRYDLTAPLAARMWAASGQGTVDAVIAVDPVFLQQVLAVTGAVKGPNGPVNAANVVPELLYNQYAALPASGQQQQRKDELGAFAGAVFDRLNAGGFSFLRLGLNLAAAARGRHVLVWAVTPADETAWGQAGAAGALDPDSLAISIENRGRNKLDYFLSSHAQLTVHMAGDHSDVQLVLQLHNGAAPGGPREVEGPSPGAQASRAPGQALLGPGDYLGVVAFTVPASATGVSIGGTSPAPLDGPDGPVQVIGDQYEIARGRDLSITLRFRLPHRARTMVIEPSARVPGLTWQVGPAAYTDDQAHVLTW